MAVKSIENNEQFETLISSPKLTVVHFYAAWVPQCEAMAKVLETHASGTQNVNFCQLTAEDFSEISLKNNVTSVPTFVMFHSGQVVGRVVGADAPQLNTKIEQLLLQGAPPETSKSEKLEEELKKLINAAPVMLFMKGTALEPRCGFSRQIVAILDELKADYKTFDILSNEDVRQGLKKFSDWPTYPQLYIKGELIGGLDIVNELKENGELAAMLPKKVNIDDRLKSLVNEHPCMVFMKGNREVPRCGFSKQLMEILKETGAEFKTFDILEDEEVRQGLKKFSNWPTYPQVYVKGDLIGGLDIIKELKESGELIASLKGES